MEFVTHPSPGQEVRIEVREHEHQPQEGTRFAVQVGIQSNGYAWMYPAIVRVMPDGTIIPILPQDRSQADDIEAAVRAYLDR